ncbi:MAG TPA: hypothetical protein VGB98_10855 [Pyrinomonadaceae bacterium]|jgi:hypothetical protein
MKKALALLLLVTVTALFSYRAGEAQGALQVCVDAPGTQRTRILNAYTGAHGYQPTVKDAAGQDVPNPQTRAQFFKQKLAETVRETVKSYEAGLASEDARKAAAKRVDDETGIQ